MLYVSLGEEGECVEGYMFGERERHLSHLFLSLSLSLGIVKKIAERMLFSLLFTCHSFYCVERSTSEHNSYYVHSIRDAGLCAQEELIEKPPPLLSLFFSPSNPVSFSWLASAPKTHILSLTYTTMQSR